MSIRLHVVDREGEAHEVHAPARGSLMEVLRELEYGVAATCGGTISCATCHVYLASDWFARLPAEPGDERELISALAHARETSRLACQIDLSEALDGLRVTIAPDE